VAAIRTRDPDVPAAVIVLGAGSLGASPGRLRLGHFAATRWRRGEDDLPEVFLGGEGLRGGPVDVLGALLHEAAHGLADVRGIPDTSRQGRYHNRRYAALARELGLDVTQAPGIGWSATSVPAGTAAGYRTVLDDLAAALTLWRRSEHPRGRRGSNNPLTCSCPCGRRIRAAAATLAAGPIRCGLCDSPFTPAPRS
jgi:hypothetical protein